MKYKVVATVGSMLLLTVLTACGTGGTVTGSESSVSSEPSPTPSPTKTSVALPDVTGKQASAASAILTSVDFQTVFVDKSGARWGMVTPNKDVTIVGTDPVAGTWSKGETVKLITSLSPQEQGAAEKAAADAAKLAVRYEFSCGIGSTVPSTVFHSYKEVWGSTYYGSSSSCLLEIDGEYMSDKPALIPSEQAIVDVVANSGGDVSAPASTFGSVYDLCARVKPGYVDDTLTSPMRKKAEAKAALAMCPDAPHAGVLQEVIETVKYGDGQKVVGTDMEPGTYRTKPSTKDCYWSRNTGRGDIIANDFVGFAPDGVTVSVYQGEGFESSRCGVWTKIG